MQVYLKIDTRKFGTRQQEEAAGYYDTLDEDNLGRIRVDSTDEVLEQIGTLYHEFTHFVYDIVNRLSEKKVKQLRKKKKRAKSGDVVYVEANEDLEERLCQAVEKAVHKEYKKFLKEQLKKR